MMRISINCRIFKIEPIPISDKMPDRLNQINRKSSKNNRSQGDEEHQSSKNTEKTILKKGFIIR